MYLRERLSTSFVVNVSSRALVVGSQELTYGSLDTMSSILAGWLERNLSVKYLPVVCEQSAETVIAYLAALRTGKTFVAIDPREPTNRKREFLEVLQCQCLFTTTSKDLDDGIPTFALRDLITDGSPLEPWYRWQLDETAWMYFTSGSTGAPKAVPVPYRRRVKGSFTVDEMRREARLGIASPLSFLAGGTATLDGLSQGADVHLLHYLAQDLRGTINYARSSQLTHLTLPPSTFRGELVDSLGLPVLTVEEIVLTGERSTEQDLNKMRKVFPNALFHNSYGSTELGTVARFRIPPTELIPSDPIPVGETFDCEVYILDDEHRQLGVGEVGQIAVVSERRSPGYLEGAQSVDLQMVQIQESASAVLTGDAGFFGEDGLLYVIGRIGDVIKINGQLTNAASVQSVLLRHTSVLEAEVLGYEDSRGRTRLGAVVVMQQGVTTTVRDLRLHLLNALPPWMVPTKFLVVESIPRGQRGKTNRVELQRDLSNSKRDYKVTAEMGDPLLWKIHGLLSGFVDLEGIHVEDNLQTIGLDSLDVIELVYQFEMTFGVKIPISRFASKWSLSSLRSWVVDEGSRRANRIVTVTVGPEETELYWLMPGTNLIVGMALAGHLSEFSSKFFVAKGAESRDVPHLDIASCAEELVEQFVRQMTTDRFALVGFSSAAWIVQHMAVLMSRLGISPHSVVLLDPPFGDSVSVPTAPPDPSFLMYAREGLLATAHPRDADEQLLTLQTFGLRHHMRKPYQGRSLVIVTRQDDEVRRELGEVLPIAEILRVHCEHLELMRNPQICGPQLREFLRT